jgi:hypothetical protein
MQETEVYRISPQKGKCYYTAEWTKRVGRWPNEKYFTTNPLTYVGEYLRTERYGMGDGGRAIDFFLLNEKEVQVEYTYEGTTSFVEKN